MYCVIWFDSESCSHVVDIFHAVRWFAQSMRIADLGSGEQAAEEEADAERRKQWLVESILNNGREEHRAEHGERVHHKRADCPALQ